MTSQLTLEEKEVFLLLSGWELYIVPESADTNQGDHIFRHIASHMIYYLVIDVAYEMEQSGIFDTDLYGN